MLKGKRIVLGVCGGIAVYKAVALCSRLTQAGARVQVIMTESATKFVTPLTFQTMSRHEVALDTFEEKDPEVVSHINIADHADLVIIAPATANMIAKMAHGIGDDMLSTTLLAVTAPIYVAPAMNVHMYEHPAVMHNMDLLRRRGVRFIEPGEGQLACGYVGKGRLAEPEEIMQTMIEHFRHQGSLSGTRLLVTAGSTIERLDPVRYLTNDSSGRMGISIAEAARDLGAEVTLVAGRVSVPLPTGVDIVSVESAKQMLDAVLERMSTQQVIIKTAAVADYRPKDPSTQKIKKKEQTLTIELVKNEDILQTVGHRKAPHQVVVGFAAETENLEQNGLEKLQRKKCDFIVANDVTLEGAGFGTDTNIVQIFNQHGLVESLPIMHKRQVAERLLQHISAHMQVKGGL